MHLSYVHIKNLLIRGSDEPGSDKNNLINFIFVFCDYII